MIALCTVEIESNQNTSGWIAVYYHTAVWYSRPADGSGTPAGVHSLEYMRSIDHCMVNCGSARVPMGLPM